MKDLCSLRGNISLSFSSIKNTSRQFHAVVFAIIGLVNDTPNRPRQRFQQDVVSNQKFGHGFSGLSGSSLRKVPEIILLFWVVKILSTAMGEATSDFLVFKINPYVAVTAGGVVLCAVLLLQFTVRKYIAWVYWLAVVIVAVFGTMSADSLHIQLGIPYIISTLFFMVVLVVVFIMWYKTEKTLSIHSITTRRRELFYWATVLSTFALGTAIGDLSATTFGLGYFLSGIVFTLLFLIPAIGYRWFNLNEIVAFWFAYVVTRPLGASFADWMGKPTSHGGLGWGDGTVSVLLTILIVICVVYLSITKKDAKAVH